MTTLTKDQIANLTKHYAEVKDKTDANKLCKDLAKFKMDDKVIDTTEFIKGVGTITEVALNPTRSARYHIDFKDTNESGWFREEELKASE
jgi:hypothetical protein|tara:strand:- start:354 stop:623 length:270 start_codon:yes stop_codon:yes gene_type:complete